MQSQTELLTPKEVEKIFKIKTGALANWRSQGRGPKYYKLEGKILYKYSEILEWVNRNAVHTIHSDPSIK